MDESAKERTLAVARAGPLEIGYREFTFRKPIPIVSQEGQAVKAGSPRWAEDRATAAAALSAAPGPPGGAGLPTSLDTLKKVGMPLTFRDGKSGDRSDEVGLKTLAANLRKAGFGDKASQLERCGTEYFLYRCSDCQKEWVTVSRCGLRLCPRCASLRAWRLAKKYEEVFRRPDLRHLVLTSKPVRWGLRERIQGVRAAFKRLLHRKVFARAWAGPGCGGIYTVEITYKPQRGFYVHLHALIAGAYLPQAVVSHHWADLTGCPVCWISRATNPKESLKYVAKPSRDLWADPQALRELFLATKRLHFIGGWGVAGAVRGDSLQGDMLCPYCGSAHISWLATVSKLDKWVRELLTLQEIACGPPPGSDDL